MLNTRPTTLTAETGTILRAIAGLQAGEDQDVDFIAPHAYISNTDMRSWKKRNVSGRSAFCSTHLLLMLDWELCETLHKDHGQRYHHVEAHDGGYFPCWRLLVAHRRCCFGGGEWISED